MTWNFESILLYAGAALCVLSVLILLLVLLLLSGKKKLIQKQLELEYGKRPDAK